MINGQFRTVYEMANKILSITLLQPTTYYNGTHDNGEQLTFSTNIITSNEKVFLELLSSSIIGCLKSKEQIPAFEAFEKMEKCVEELQTEDFKPTLMNVSSFDNTTITFLLSNASEEGEGSIYEIYLSQYEINIEPEGYADYFKNKISEKELKKTVDKLEDKLYN